jgi:hypothetical protein
MPTTPEQPVRPRDAAIKPLVVRPRAAKQMLGNCSDEELYRKIRTGEVVSYLDGRRRLITVESIEADIARKIVAAAEQGFQRARGADHDGLGRRTRRAEGSAT